MTTKILKSTPRFCGLIIICLLVIFSSIPIINAAGPSLYAEAAILMDADTGQILYAKNQNKQMAPASLTKIMTCLLAMDLGSEDELVSVTEEALRLTADSSAAGLRTGQKFTLSELLYALMLPSANDAANAIAIHFAGTTEAFAEMMTQKAIDLGLSGTNFLNSHGLPMDGHYTTAYDLAVITREALKYTAFRTYASTNYYEVPETPSHPRYYLSNTHRMIGKSSSYYNPYVVAGKTGWTTEAGNCLMTTFEVDGRTLIAIVLKSDNPKIARVIYQDTKALFEYGQNGFKKVELSLSPVNLGTGTFTDDNSTDYEVELSTNEKSVSIWVPNSAKDVQLSPDIDKSFSWDNLESLPRTISVYATVDGNKWQEPIDLLTVNRSLEIVTPTISNITPPLVGQLSTFAAKTKFLVPLLGLVILASLAIRTRNF